MPVQDAKIPNKNFRQLIRGILKFRPSNLPGGELINFAVNGGRARASIGTSIDTVISSGLIMSGAHIDPFSVHHVSIASYANQLPDEGTLTIELSRKDKHVLFLCDNAARLKIALTDGVVLPRPKAPEPFFTADEETVKVLKSLAGVAEKDETKPDMSCVYLRHGTAMAGNQKCIAVVHCGGLPDVEMALPLNVCQALEPGDKLAITDGGLMVINGNCISQVPRFEQALHFPVGVVDRLEQTEEEVYGTIQIDNMRNVFKLASDCVARIPGVQACMNVTFSKGSIQASARTKQANYKKALEGEGVMDGEIVLELPEAEDALGIFGSNNVICKKLKPKGESLLEGGGAKAFFAPVHVVPI